MFKILLQGLVFLWTFFCYTSTPPTIKHTYHNGSKALIIANQQGPSAGQSGGGGSGLSNPVTPSQGGTGLTSITSHDLMIGNGTSTVTVLAPSATVGIPLVSQGSAADPAYSTAVVAGGGTGVTSLTSYALLSGGTTATNPVQSLASVGNLQDLLSSRGSGALPVWLPLLVKTATVTLSAAQVQALDTTPITVVPAPGAGKITLVLYCVIKLNYTGTPFAGAGDLRLAYAGPTTIITTAMSSAVKNASSNQIAPVVVGSLIGTAYTNVENINVILYSTGATTGGGTNTLDVVITYMTLTI